MWYIEVMDWARLWRQIVDNFQRQDLITLCFLLSIDYDDLGGDGRDDKARELILEMRQQSRVDDLVAELRKLRPKVAWEDPPELEEETVEESQPAVYGQRARPAMGGDSISHYRSGVVTLGCLVVDRQVANRVYLLSELYGLSPPDGLPRVGDPVIQPGGTDGGNIARDMIATIARAGTLNDDPLAADQNIPAAIAQVRHLKDVSAEIRGRGYLKGVRPATEGITVYGVGRTSGLVTGMVLRTETTVDIAMPVNKLAYTQNTGDAAGNVSLLFANLIACNDMFVNGDGGMILLDEENYALGLAFAGDDEESFFLPMQRVLDTLEVDLVTEAVWQSLTGS